MKKDKLTMGLDPYKKKRDFESTPEPDATAENNFPAFESRAKRKAKTAGIFVVQKHAARRLHFDFRLELAGVLKSWAVPKGPSLDPSAKRMAVHVEDHPLSYANFEGTIPAGNYGAGTVIVWDSGTWIPHGDAADGYAKGHLKFELRGHKLRGLWNLVRMHARDKNTDTWLLLKEQDEEARPTAQYDILEAEPDSISNESIGRVTPQPLMMAPQLATLVDAPPPQSNWIYEIKFDGYRMMSRIDAQGDIHLFTRSGNDWTKKLGSIAAALKKWRLDEAWLDGEIVVLDAAGLSNFQKLQNAFESNRTDIVRYMIFDIVYYAGRDLRALSLLQRRWLLRQLMRKNTSDLLQFSDDIDANTDDLLATACRMGVEGLIGKRIESHYTPGRTRDWIKLKCLQRQEFVIGGYTEASNKDTRSVSALLLGVHDADGALHYVGKVGTGFTQQSARTLHEKLQLLQAAKNPFSDNVRQRDVHWVKPNLLAEVAFSGWTTAGHIRHSSFQGLCNDKATTAITRELPVPLATKKINPAKITPQIAGIDITHPDRIIDTASGTTKYALARYYEFVAPYLLPHLKDRPVSLVRAPNGVGAETFFQKHRGNLAIPELIELDKSLLPDHPPLIAIESVEGLIHCVQMNVVEFHTWNACVGQSEQPDRIVFDLDPGENVTWPQIVDAAQLLKEFLEELHLKSFLKTSGGKGLHVIVPLAPDAGWLAVKNFSQALVKHLAHTLPQLFVATSGPKNRIGRIFIDYLRNNRGSTTVAAFSARLRPGLGVSTPLAWMELPALHSSDQWSVQTIDPAVARERDRQWRGYARLKQTLSFAEKYIK